MGNKIKYIVSIILLVVFYSCDPDVPGEGISLPPMEFAFKVSPDTAYMKVGDTFTMHASISSTLSNGVKLTDGEGEVWVFISRGNSIPKESVNDIYEALNNEDFRVLIEGGGVKWVKDNPNRIYRFTSFPTGDSIIMHYKFVFFKKGLFRFGSLQPSFYESSKGKTRWNAYFDVDNPNWDKFWEVAGNPAPTPNEDHYKRNYLIAVTD